MQGLGFRGFSKFGVPCGDAWDGDYWASLFLGDYQVRPQLDPAALSSSEWVAILAQKAPTQQGPGRLQHRGQVPALGMRTNICWIY